MPLAAPGGRSTIDLSHSRGMSGPVETTCQTPTGCLGTTRKTPMGAVETTFLPLTGRGETYQLLPDKGHRLMFLPTTTTHHRSRRCSMWTTRDSLLDMQITLRSHRGTHHLFRLHKVHVSEWVRPLGRLNGCLVSYTAPACTVYTSTVCALGLQGNFACLGVVQLFSVHVCLVEYGCCLIWEWCMLDGSFGSGREQ